MSILLWNLTMHIWERGNFSYKQETHLQNDFFILKFILLFFFNKYHKENFKKYFQIDYIRKMT